MIAKYLRQLLYIFFLVASQFIAAQQTKKQPLSTVITNIENRYNVKFSYPDSLLNSLQFQPISETLSLEEILKLLNKKTLLHFKKLSDRYITVNRKKVSVCRIVKDKKTNTPIENAHITVANKHYISDKNGIVNFIATLNEPVKISSLGYKTKILNEPSFLKERKCANVFLNLELNQLKEVFISTYLTKGITPQKDGAIVLKPQKLELLPGLIEPDVFQTIQLLPGIESFNESVTEISIRGGDHYQNSFLWNDIQIYQTGHFFGLISAFNPYLTDTVKLIKNGTDPSYRGGVSGIIDFSSKNEIFKKTSAAFGANLTHADAFIRQPIGKKLALEVSGRHSFDFFMNTPTFEAYFDKSFQNSELNPPEDGVTAKPPSKQSFTFTDYDAKLIYIPNSKNTFNFKIKNIKNNLDATLFYEDDNGTANNVLNQQNTAYGLYWKNKLNDKWNFLVNSYISEFNIENFLFFNNMPTPNFQEANTLSDINFKASSIYNFKKPLKLELGYHYSYLHTKFNNKYGNEFAEFDNITTSISNKLNLHALFSKISFTNNSKNLTAIAGIRTQLASELDIYTFEPRLSIHKKISPSFSMQLLGEIKSQYLSQIFFNKGSFLGVDSRSWLVPFSDSEDIIMSHQISIGTQFKKKSLLINFETYYKYLNNLLAASQLIQGLEIDAIIENTGTRSIIGAETLFNYTTKKFNSFVSYSINNSDFTYTDNFANITKKYDRLQHSLQFGTTYQLGSFSLSLGAKWLTGSDYTSLNNETPLVPIDDFVNELNFNEVADQRNDDYFRVDTSLRYKFFINKKKDYRCSLGLSILNILNKENILSTRFTENVLVSGDPNINFDEISPIIRVDNKGLKLTPNLNFRVWL